MTATKQKTQDANIKNIQKSQRQTNEINCLTHHPVLPRIIIKIVSEADNGHILLTVGDKKEAFKTQLVII